MQTPKPSPYTTIELLKKLTKLPGMIDIHVHALNGHYVPFVFYNDSHQRSTEHGPIIMGEQIVAALDFDDLIDALHESLGQNLKIYAPKTEGFSEHGLQ